MKPLTWLVLLFACVGVAGGAVVGVGGRQPSPYVDDWSDVELRGSGVDASAAVQACLDASGRAIFRVGTYTLDPNAAQAVLMSDGDLIEGAGMGLSILQIPDNETGAAVLLGSDCVIRDVTFDAFDDAGTVGARMSSNKHRGMYVRVEFSDMSNGSSDGGAAVNGLKYLGCKFTSNITSGLAILNASTGVVVRDCVFNGNPIGVAFGGSPLGVEVTGSTFVNETIAITANGGTPSGVLIEGNDFLAGTTSIGFATYGSRNAIGENYFAFDEILPSDVTDKQILLRGRYYGTASPSAGTWLTGDIVHNNTPSTSGATATHWICSTGGASGTWNPAYRSQPHLVVTETYDPASMNDNTGTSKSDFSVTGAALGNRVAAAAPYEIPAGVMVTASVVSTNTIRVSLWNHSGGVVDLASGNWTIEVTQ